MARIGFFLLFFALFLFTVDCNVTEKEVKQLDSNSGLDPKNNTQLKDENISDATLGKGASNLDSTKVEKGKKGKVPNGGLDEGGKEDSKQNDSIKDLGLKQNHEVDKDKGGEGKDLGTDGVNEKGGSKNAGSGSEVLPKEDVKDGELGLSKSLRKDNSRLEECDESNRCVDEKNMLVACLRVQGNESPDLSLLIQNRGTGSLKVSIKAPDSVHLEQTMVQLQEKEDTKVKVSIANGGNDTVIVLTAGHGPCKLNFRDMILPDSGKEVEYSSMSTYSGLLTRSFAIYLFIAVLLFIGAAWAFVKFWRRRDPRYQKVNTELPVSNGGKMEMDVSDGWDNSWGDNWDDEEAQKTPSKLISNLSSKGLAPRRSNLKDGWHNSWKD